MSEQHYEAELKIINELGMHARAATKFVQLASQFPCDVSVEKDGQQVNGKSIMGVLMLVAAQGTVIKIVCDGQQAGQAGAALTDLVNDRFGEDK